MKRMMIYIAASYAALLGGVTGLSIALARERKRTCINIPEVPQQVRKKMSDLASLAADTAADIDSLAHRGLDEAKSVAERGVHVLR